MSDADEARLRRSVVIAGGLRAGALRLSESQDAEVRRGRWTSHRRGLPPGGARRGVTHHDVEVGMRIEGDARTD